MPQKQKTKIEENLYKDVILFEPNSNIEIIIYQVPSYLTLLKQMESFKYAN